MSPSIEPEIANFNPTAFALANQQRQANLATTQQEQQLRAQDIGLRQQQVQQAQLNAQITQQQLRDSQAYTQAFSKYDSSSPTAQEDLEKSFIAAGGSGQGLLSLREAQLGWQQKVQSLDEGRLKIEDTINQRTADALQSFKADIAKNPAAATQLWAQVYGPRMQEIHPDQKVDLANPPVGTTLDAQIGATAHLKDLTENRLKEFQGKEAQARAHQAEAEASAKELQTKLEQTQLDLFNSLRAHPEDLQQRIAKSVNPQEHPEEFQAALNEAQLAPDYKGIVAAIDKHGQNVREFEKTKALETDPQILAIRQKQQQTQAQFQNALQQGDTARAKYFESLSDVQQAVATSATIQKVLDLSRSGNAVAASQLKAMVPEFTNAVQDIKRMAASQGDKGLGSAQEHLASEIASIAKGKPLSDSVMNEIAPYVQTIANGATSRHNATVDAITRAYPNFKAQHEAMPYANVANAPKAAGSRKVGDPVTLKGGKKVTITKTYPDGSFDYE